MQNKTPLRKFGLFKMTIMNVAKVQFKGKAGPADKLVVSFRDDEDRWMDANFLLPMNQFSEAGYKSLLKEAGVIKPADLKGVTLVVLIAPAETKDGKVWWNPKKYFGPTYIKYLTEGEDTFGIDDHIDDNPTLRNTSFDDL